MNSPRLTGTHRRWLLVSLTPLIFAAAWACGSPPPEPDPKSPVEVGQGTGAQNVQGEDNPNPEDNPMFVVKKTAQPER